MSVCRHELGLNPQPPPPAIPTLGSTEVIGLYVFSGCDVSCVLINDDVLFFDDYFSSYFGII